MTRNLMCAAVVVATLAGSARAGAPAPPPSTLQKFATADVVVTGKVTAVEKGTVEATAPFFGAKNKVAYTVAVVKIDGALFGAPNLTHVKVGFVPPDPNAPPLRGSGGVIRPREPVPVLKAGDEALLFLTKHPTAGFYVMPYRHLPVDTRTEAGKKELETVKTYAAALADPMKGLKSGKVDVRAKTAALVLMKYRSSPTLGANVEQVEVPVEESRLILAGLAEGDWSFQRGEPAALQGFYQLGLTEKDGWKPPAPKPGQDFNAALKEAFAKWVDGPGRDYRVKKFVAKK